MPKVSFFASSFANREASGTSSLALNLVKKLSLEEFSEIELELLYKNDLERQVVEDRYQLRANHVVLPNVQGKFLRSSRQFYRFVREQSSHRDILHLTVPRFYPYIDLFPATGLVCTFHAAGDITAPKDFFSFSREAYNLIAKWQWNRLNKIVAVSDQAREEISYSYRIPESRIDVILPGADSLWDLEESRSPLEGLFAGEPYILILGRFQSFKNVHTVLEVIRDNHARCFSHLGIVVLARGSGPLADHCLKIIAELGEKAVHINFASPTEYAWLMQNASLVIHPSINEGFGIPAFEAFGEGSSILVHKSSPAAAMLGAFNGVMCVDMLDTRSVLDSIMFNLDKTNYDITQRRHFLDGIGATWQKMASRYQQLYLEVLGQY